MLRSSSITTRQQRTRSKSSVCGFTRDGVPIARSARTFDNSPPRRRYERHLLVPLQLVSEVFPGVVPNARWVFVDGQLVVLTTNTSGALLVQRRRTRFDATNDADRRNELRKRVASPSPRSTIGGPLSSTLATRGRQRHERADWQSPRIYEKDVTLAVALKLGEQLKARGRRCRLYADQGP